LRRGPGARQPLAAEHVELAVDDPERCSPDPPRRQRSSWAAMTPEAVGDYVAGPNHVLPTGRRARFSSGLSVLDFMKRTSFIQLDEAALKPRSARRAIALADAEGLPAHAAR
jgi:histidinol dehydrogenase